MRKFRFSSTFKKKKTTTTKIYLSQTDTSLEKALQTSVHYLFYLKLIPAESPEDFKSDDKQLH